MLAEAESALENVTAGINRVAHVSNMTKEAEETAREVEGLTMPVSVQEIQTLVNEIKNTNVDEGLVNSTYQGAAEGLGTAQKVEALAQRARWEHADPTPHPRGMSSPYRPLLPPIILM